MPVRFIDGVGKLFDIFKSRGWTSVSVLALRSNIELAVGADERTVSHYITLMEKHGFISWNKAQELWLLNFERAYELML